MKVVERLELSFRTAAQLNKIIDETLPGRPTFRRHELIVGGEVCEVFYRDVIECIRGIFGDPTFTPYLIVAPEKHYTCGVGQGGTARMYHDLHTGKWWWATQVGYFSAEFSGGHTFPLDYRMPLRMKNLGQPSYHLSFQLTKHNSLRLVTSRHIRFISLSQTFPRK